MIFQDLCFWHVISQLGIAKFDEILKLEIAVVSALCWLSQLCTLNKKIGIGWGNIRKFVISTHTKQLFLWQTKDIEIK